MENKPDDRTPERRLSTIIAGGRGYFLTPADVAWLDTLPIREVVSGGARGVDQDGERWAASRNIPVKLFPAEWNRYGLRAGPLRNRQMAEYAEAAALFPGGRGTANMWQEAEKRGLHIFVRPESHTHRSQ